ncbi:MAG TPA: hypothetical protein VLJ79_02325, partial [Candidatus Binatia bacterium]|nr:hypothetical protein [Candidatus Binatia bacterium]
MNQKPRKRAIMLGDYTNNPRSQSELFHRARAALWRFFPRVWWRHGFRVIAAVLVIGGCACGAIAGEATQPAAEPAKVAPAQEAALVVSRQPITVFRVS